MAQVSNTPIHTGARRRSQRVLMQVGVRIRGKDAQGKDFEEFTETLAINAHGALVLLNARLTSGGVVLMKNATWHSSARFAVARRKLASSLQPRARPSGAWRFLPKTGLRRARKPVLFLAIAPTNNFLASAANQL